MWQPKCMFGKSMQTLLAETFKHLINTFLCWTACDETDSEDTAASVALTMQGRRGRGEKAGSVTTPDPLQPRLSNLHQHGRHRHGAGESGKVLLSLCHLSTFNAK